MTDNIADEKAASWEKTVEWAFVRKYLPNAEFAAPIDGDHEISDAILAQRGQWFLIEFKHTENQFASEKDKYPYISRDRTYSVLRNNYKTYVSQLKEIKSIVPKAEWIKAVLQYEYELMGARDAKQFEEASLLKKATLALGHLWETYSKMNPEAKNNLAPHFFVFSRQNKFERLWAIPYWTNWLNNKEDKRGWEAFDPELIGMYGQTFEAFSDYVLKLAMARGYNVKRLENEGKIDFKAVVFGRVSGFSRNRTIAMSLDNFLLTHEILKSSYELSKSKPEERNATVAHLPKLDSWRL